MKTPRTEQQYAALNAISKRCNDKLKQVDSKNLPLLKSITDTFSE